MDFLQFIGMYLSIKWIVVTYFNGLNTDYFEDVSLVSMQCLLRFSFSSR